MNSNFQPRNCPPLVSIGMPVYNCQNTIQLAINSILSQTFSDWELIIINDCSSDKTSEIVNQYQDKRIRFLDEKENLGLSARLIQSLALSKGKYFARMDGDDISYKSRLEIQLKYLEEHPEVDLVGCQIVVFGKQGKLRGGRKFPEQHELICNHPYNGFPIAHPTYVGKIEWFTKYSYRIKFGKAQDQDLLLRSYRTSKFANVPNFLLGYREPQIYLKKLLISRLFLTLSFIENFVKQPNLNLLLKAITGQLLKAIVDIIATLTCTKSIFHKHRTENCLSPHDKSQWELEWTSVNKKTNTFAL